MPDLPTGTLGYFPVHYPSEALASGIDVLQTVRPRAARSGWDPREIGFGRNFGQERNGRVEGHGAIDIFGAFGCEVRATVSGRVVENFVNNSGRHPGVGYSPSTPENRIAGGNYVMIVDASGFHHYFAHMRDALVLQTGEEVAIGQRLGVVGATGMPSGYMQHLHYQVTTRQGRLINYNPYAELRRLATALGAEVNAGGYVRLPLAPDARRRDDGRRPTL